MVFRKESKKFDGENNDSCKENKKTQFREYPWPGGGRRLVHNTYILALNSSFFPGEGHTP